MPPIILNPVRRPGELRATSLLLWGLGGAILCGVGSVLAGATAVVWTEYRIARPWEQAAMLGLAGLFYGALLGLLVGLAVALVAPAVAKHRARPGSEAPSNQPAAPQGFLARQLRYRLGYGILGGLLAGFLVTISCATYLALDRFHPWWKQIAGERFWHNFVTVEQLMAVRALSLGPLFGVLFYPVIAALRALLRALNSAWK